MRTALLSPGVNPIAVNKYIVSYHITCRSHIRPLSLRTLCCTVWKMFRRVGWTGKTRSCNSITWRFSTSNSILRSVKKCGKHVYELIYALNYSVTSSDSTHSSLSQPTLRTMFAGAQHQPSTMTAAQQLQCTIQYSHRHGTTFLLQMAHPRKIMLLITVTSSVFQRNLQYSQCR